MREICPEGRENRVQALGDELGWVLACCLHMEYVGCLVLIVAGKLEVCATLVSRHVTLGTSILSTTHHQILFWVIPNKGHKHGVYSSDEPISTHHIDTLPASSYKGLNKPPHAIVKEAVSSHRVVLEGFKLRDR